MAKEGETYNSERFPSFKLKKPLMVPTFMNTNLEPDSIACYPQLYLFFIFFYFYYPQAYLYVKNVTIIYTIIKVIKAWDH